MIRWTFAFDQGQVTTEFKDEETDRDTEVREQIGNGTYWLTLTVYRWRFLH